MERTGTKLGRYTILKELASDGMAQVFLARAHGMEGFQHHVVIKVLRAGFAHDPQIVSLFLDEARLAATLHHHHIVQVHDVGHEAGAYFFAMEYVHGEDLRKLLTRLARNGEQLPFDHIVTITTAVAAALHHAHEQLGADRQPLEIVHRDVSPANIVVGYDGNVKVVDFGIAKAAMRSAETASGTLRGKVAYMAPEQCLGHPVDRRSDVFALGSVLYELCTARRLFKSSTDYATMTAIVAGKIPRPSTLRAELPDALERIILKALALAPDARYQTTEHMGLDLERAAGACELRVSPTALAEYLSSVFGRRTEPWLVEGEAAIELDDVDFDGAGEGVAEMSAAELSRVEAARLRLGAATAPARATVDDADENEFANEPRTAATDLDEMQTILTDGGELGAAVEAARLLRGVQAAATPASPVATEPAGAAEFDPANEQTAIADNADVDLLVRLSQIQPAVGEPPAPPTAATAPPTDHARVERPPPAPLPRSPTPVPIPRASTPAPFAPNTGGTSTGWAAPGAPAIPPGPPTGTPMAWVPQSDGDIDVPSLAPPGRRLWLIGGTAAVLLIAGILFTNRSDDARPAHSPDAGIEPDAAVIDAAPMDAAVADAAPPAIQPGHGSAVEPADAKPAIKRPSKRPIRKKPIRKKPIRKR